VNDVWNVVLAAGSGRRLAALTGGVPKQFWRRDGGPTLLEDTLERTSPLASRARTVIVVDSSHSHFVTGSAIEAFEHVVYQPTDRGTAAGVLFGLVEVLSSSPQAMLLVTPSDHGVTDRARYIDGVRDSMDQIRRGRTEVVLFGVAATAPVVDYGWIVPGNDPEFSGTLRPVSSFVEKPALDQADELFAAEAVWNTMVLATRAFTLFELFRRHVPDLAGVFSDALARPRAARAAFLRNAYADLPATDFSRDVLGKAQGLSVHTWPASMGWSDLGTPDRLDEWRGVQSLREPESADRKGFPGDVHLRFSHDERSPHVTRTRELPATV